ncbi:glycosyltransferase 87 family protein [Cutibacterium equinum]|uniref:Glycosyltransferase 87 family protein n=1 Tax=Cutibacterium equinum TaxID=3016342 RepID=A0ABY7R175_9ACTN|nr:glycosyltransferase 87 family protein [Cutibacterium equinum]WCC81022.1 glycosyltransferase 87 family protein [Cutibacterium equinum]
MPNPTDLRIYRDCVRAMLHDPKSLYTATSVSHLGFTYPPFAAIALVPLTLLPFHAATILHYAVSATALVIMIDVVWRRCGRQHSGVLTAIVAAILVAGEPIGQSFAYGQVNVQLALLVVLDVFVVPRRWRGVGVGVATGFKLTPGIFAIWYLVTGQVKEALRAAGAGVTTIALGFAIAPTASWQYWTHYMVTPQRLGGLTWAGNQSLSGMLLRLGHGDLTPVWLILVAVCCALAGIASRRLWHHGGADEVWSLLCAGLCGCLVSPVSWSHHWVWAALLIVAGLADRRRDRRVLALAWAFVTLTWIIWWSPAGGSHEVSAPWWQKVLTDSYEILGVGSLLALAWSQRASAPRHVTGGPSSDPPVTLSHATVNN